MSLTTQPIIIALNKTKIIPMFVGSLVFVILGLWLILMPPKTGNSYWGNETKMRIAGYASTIFFGTCGFLYARKLSDNKPGLVIDDQGFTDNSSSVAAGQVLWSDVNYISVTEVSRQKFVMIFVNNPTEYIDRQSSFFKRKVMAMNYKMYDTPINISANSLKISFPELYSTLKDKFENRKGKSTKI
jgi:hypothetical protein